MKKYILKIKGWMAMRLLFNALYIVVIAGIPYIIKLALDYDYSKGSAGIIKLIAGYLGIAAAGMFFQYLSQVSGWKLDKQFYLLIKRDIFEAVIRRNNKDFRKKEIAEYVSILNNDVPTLEEYIQSIIVIFESITQIIAYAVYLLILDVRVALIIMASSVIALLLPEITGKEVSSRRKGMLESTGKYMNRVTDLLSGFSDINRETKRQIVEEQQKNLNQMENDRLHYGKFRAFSIVLNGMCMYLLDITAFSAVVISLLFQTITVGTAAAMLSYIKEFTFPIRYLVDGITTMKSTKGVKKEILEILSYQDENKEQITKFEQIQFEHAKVEWEGFAMDFSYSFEKGKKYALIGHSGSGKSTVLRMLMQLEEPDSGAVRIDNRNVNEIDYTSLVANLTQKEHVYQDSFENNVTVFGSYITKGIREVVDFAESQRIRMLQDKKDCSELSGGERNLLAIVKTLVKDKEILLLDEPFAALDVANKRLLQKKIYHDLPKTIIAVTHDISEDCLKYFDEILIMENGKLVAAGPGADIMNSKEYQKLASH